MLFLNEVSGEPLVKVPSSFVEMVSLYGDPRDSDFPNNLIVMPLPYPLKYDGISVVRCTFHKKGAPNLWAALSLINERGLMDLFTNYCGTYNYRTKRGQPFISTHAFGIAIDGDCKLYPLRSKSRYPQEIIECFTQFGFFYGGDFKSRADPMHFQLAMGY